MKTTNNIYRIFYDLAIMPGSEIPSINRIKSIFKNLSHNEFIELNKSILESNNFETYNSFLYYIILFRDMENVQDFVNSEDFSVDLLERLLLFTHGYCILYDFSLEYVLDDILYFIENKRLFELTLFSEHISRDKLLLFYILSKFDTEILDQYFMRIRNVTEFIDYFLRLPEKVMRSIITRNYKLFQYIMILMAEHDYNEEYTEKFLDKYKDDIEQFSKLSDVIRYYKKKNDITIEKALPINKRDMGRISFIVNKVREMSNAEKTIEYFDSENIFADEQEKQIVRSIIFNPLFKNVFKSGEKVA